MAKQYRFDLHTLQIREFRGELIATLREGGGDESGQGLEWKLISLWHGVYGWAYPDGTIAIRYVPAGGDDNSEYLITVERPIENEFRLVASGALRLRTAGRDFFTSPGVVEMRR